MRCWCHPDLRTVRRERCTQHLPQITWVLRRVWWFPLQHHLFLSFANEQWLSPVQFYSETRHFSSDHYVLDQFAVFYCLAMICLAHFWLRAWPDSTPSSCGFGSDGFCNQHDVSGCSACAAAKSTKMEKETMAERICSHKMKWFSDFLGIKQLVRVSTCGLNHPTLL